MNHIDASAHYDETAFKTQVPSLLVVIVDLNPRAWAVLNSELPISQALANILVYINAHLAFGNENQVAVLAAHTNRAIWLYPRPPSDTSSQRSRDRDGDVDMNSDEPIRHSTNTADLGTSANKYPLFAQIESTIVASIRDLLAETTPADIEPTTTLMAGALSMALAYINKTSLAYEPAKASSDPNEQATAAVAQQKAPNLHSRMLAVSVSDSDPAQYIPTMNAIFAASHSRIPLDTLSLAGKPTFLEQAAYITGGTFLSVSSNPRGLLTHLMFGLLADSDAREALVAPTQDTVDFRVACFCHRNVVDTGFVCSICLSIFCEVPENAECLTCGNKLTLGNYGAKPAVVPRKKKKKKKLLNGAGREETGSATGTPIPAT
ncbi:TFIIH subunit Tfb4/p34 [Microdochium trichocladiopsis]|uniref:General transcription and DNA repair factor IIH subunit TFB4 n=1 Tax=Microdochium trichocladiopsis TaxID=1682393 RepID=A0A9P8YGG9_9PEZI|nr:TFIIH subunit Tfb4/p34 [Microdochium trichocladiopsis]KAH7039845.1 TFIIH subunit Tfb4/p34 [Microdochium trichocladiopsis]